MSNCVLEGYRLKPGDSIATKVKRKRVERLKPYEVFYPPDHGYPHLKHKYLEVLWLMSQGLRDSDIQRIVKCHSSYPGAVRDRFSKMTPSQLLEKYRSIPWTTLK